MADVLVRDLAKEWRIDPSNAHRFVRSSKVEIKKARDPERRGSFVSVVSQQVADELRRLRRQQTVQKEAS